MRHLSESIIMERSKYKSFFDLKKGDTIWCYWFDNKGDCTNIKEMKVYGELELDKVHTREETYAMEISEDDFETSLTMSKEAAESGMRLAQDYMSPNGFKELITQCYVTYKDNPKVLLREIKRNPQNKELYKPL